MDAVKVVVLGAPQVGKSTLIEQFVQRPPSEHVPASTFHQHHHDNNIGGGGWGEDQQPGVNSLPRRTFYPAVQLDGRLLSLRLHDLPSIETFPITSEQEWQQYRALGLRSAAAYLLVFDASAPHTFSYVRCVRQQLQASRGLHHVPVVVVANKNDRASSRQIARVTRELQTVVRKLWKWPYVSCSAKYNCHVQQVFQELTAAINAVPDVKQTSGTAMTTTAGSHSPTAAATGTGVPAINCRTPVAKTTRQDSTLQHQHHVTLLKQQQEEAGDERSRTSPTMRREAAEHDGCCVIV